MATLLTPEVARHDTRHLNPRDPAHEARFRKINPNARCPALVEPQRTRRETDAVACRLSGLVGSDFWRTTGLSKPSHPTASRLGAIPEVARQRNMGWKAHHLARCETGAPVSSTISAGSTAGPVPQADFSTCMKVEV